MSDGPQRGVTRATRWAGLSATGSKRTVNEDAFAVFAAGEVFVVADGCGGSSSGRRAAEISLSCFADDGSAAHLLEPSAASPYRERSEQWNLLGPPADSLARALILANGLVLADSMRNEMHRGQGCALAALRLQPGWSATAHIGDCRVARLREGTLAWLTEDHTLTWTLRRQGVTDDAALRRVARDHPMVITQTLGMGDELQVEVRYHRVQPGDLYLICSDGLWRQVATESISAIIRQPERPLASQCRALIEEAERAGGADNTTALLVEVLP